MPRNVEIKARIQTREEFDLLKITAAQLATEQTIHLVQEDVFFHCENGRLKLRIFGQDGKKAELIWYARDDNKDAKCSTYDILPIDGGKVAIQKLFSVLKSAHGVKCTVKKMRQVFMIVQTRVHVDDVTNLGLFAELEVALTDVQTVEQGIEIANNLAAKLKLNDRVSGAYADLLIEKEKEKHTSTKGVGLGKQNV